MSYPITAALLVGLILGISLGYQIGWGRGADWAHRLWTGRLR